VTILLPNQQRQSTEGTTSQAWLVITRDHTSSSNTVHTGRRAFDRCGSSCEPERTQKRCIFQHWPV